MRPPRRDLAIHLQPEVTFDDLLFELESLTPVRDYRPVIQAVNKARAAYDQALYQKSLSFLIQASDSLIRLKTEQADLLRRHLGGLGPQLQAV